ncbi:MAG: dihydrodipicolinate synthase family protein [Planctomycetaceae bacterium]
MSGLLAATYTPFDAAGQVRTDVIRPMVDHLIGQKISGLYVCGSTGEGMSMTTAERQAVTEAFVSATDGRVPVIVQVGHNSTADACQLASHAASAGADVISATCPSYFKPSDTQTLVKCIAEIAAAAPDKPFYYYHIPSLTGSTIDIVQFLELGRNQIPNLVGLKYTDTKLFEYQTCQAAAGGALDIVFGSDEMLLGALATGAQAAIGSTYNVIPEIYHRLMAAFEQGDLPEARRQQLKSIEFIRTVYRYPFHSAMKEILNMQGFPVGTCRLPQRSLTAEEIQSLKSDLKAIGFELPS